jgi:hypothetical protein
MFITYIYKKNIRYSSLSRKEKRKKSMELEGEKGSGHGLDGRNQKKY